MSVTDYVAETQRRILDTSYVVSHSLGYEERPPLGAIITGSVTFADGSHLYIKEFLLLRPVMVRLKYAYHYARSSRDLIFRYDNARDPAARQFSTYPHHRHTSHDLQPSSGPSLAAVLQEAAAFVRR